MGFVNFGFNRTETGIVLMRSNGGKVEPLSRPKKSSIIDVCFCPALFDFGIVEANLEGRFKLIYNNHFEITDFKIGVSEKEKPSTAISNKLLSKEFFDELINAAKVAATTKAEWFPPNSTITGDDKSTAKAGKSGFVRLIPQRPTGGRGKSRKHSRVWNDLEEIKNTVKLIGIVEALFESPHYPKGKKELSTKAKREQWVANETGVWSVGTIHAQLTLARRLGIIKPERKKK